MTTIHVAIYARVSSEDQRDNTSIDTQIADCRAEAARRGWKVYDTYIDEAESGRKENRPQLTRLRADVRTKRVQAVLVWKLDRLARKARLQHELLDEFEYIIFDSVTEHLDLKTSGGKFTHGLLAQASQLYSDMLSERVTRALRYKAEQGQWVGPVPLGYDKPDNVLVPNEAAAAVQLAYGLYATGQESFTTIADALNEAGHRTADGRLFGRESVRWLLRNRAYLGYVASGDVEYPGQHQPLIDQRTWDRCEEIRQGRTSERRGNAGLKAQGLLTGLVYCAICGAKMWQHISTTVGRAPVIYYRCSGNSRRTCQAPLQRADQVDERALDQLRAITIPERLVGLVLARLRAEVEAPPAKTVDRGAIEGQLKRLTELYVSGDIERGNYDARRAYLLDQLQLAPAAPVLRVNVEAAAHYLTDLPRLMQATSASARRSVLGAIFDRFWLLDATIRAITPKEVYATLIEVMARRISVERVADGSLLPSQHIAPCWLAHNTPRRPATAAAG